VIAPPTERWTPLRPHAEQERLWDSSARFRVVPAGRRSGKTEILKRRLVTAAMTETEVAGARFIAAAPTYAQAKEIFWRDLIALTPDWAVRKINRTELSIELINGAFLLIKGLDRPQRIEGSKLRGIGVDEIANCPAETWQEHVLPALMTSDCRGWAWLIGVPEGRNFYHGLYLDGVAGKDGCWDSFTWHSADILAPEDVALMRSAMDERTFRQECEGSFETFEGRAYYGFGPDNVRALEYREGTDLVFAFDFNVSPGVAVVLQELEMGTCVIGEVWIERDSNTPLVCEHLARKWGPNGTNHQGMVVCRGDETGGARKTSAVAGTDWDLIKNHLGRAFGQGRVRVDLPSRNPSERARVNAMNSRICAVDGERKLFVDGNKAPHVMRDLDSVEADDAGCLVKPSAGPGRLLTHPTDALGYHVHRKWPVRSGGNVMIEQF
jgi:hypothetical protein